MNSNEYLTSLSSQPSTIGGLRIAGMVPAGPARESCVQGKRPGVDWNVAVAYLSAGSLSAAGYAILDGQGPEAAYLSGHISESMYVSLTGKPLDAALRAQGDEQVQRSPWFNSPAIAAGTASVGATTALDSLTALNSWSIVVPSGYQIFRPQIRVGALVTATTGTLGLTIGDVRGGIVEFEVDWDNTTISAEDANNMRNVTCAGQVRRLGINAAPTAIAADIYAYRYELFLSRRG